ncbi:cyclic lactone autoinducer peptide [Paenibacillus sp. XY044]|nr:cyclic lactone autoinducer peptide [Paenibacillus sp. XY044]OZB98078.1 hypothetical protein CJP46_02610 [Paenibacillus sp. XY044]
MTKLNKVALVLGTIFTAIATTVASTASWTILGTEEVPNELK